MQSSVVLTPTPPPDPEPAWRNRIVRAVTLAPGDLQPHARNWRQHSSRQASLVKNSLEHIGWVKDIVASARTGRVLDGHLRLSLALQHREAAIPVLYVDVSEAEEALILATLDPITALATTDHGLWQDLLASLPPLDPALEAMVTALVKATTDMPVPGDAPRTEPPTMAFEILITCVDQAEQRSLLAAWTKEGIRCRGLEW